MNAGHPTAGMRAVLLDVDGTLVDSNDAHAQAWAAAFAEHGIAVDLPRVRRCIGMGGDKLMPAVSDVAEHSTLGSVVSARRGEIFTERFLPHLRPFRDSARLLATLRDRGYTLVAASSAKRHELQPLLAVAGADGLVHASTSSDDADGSKPEPDILLAAMRRVRASPAGTVMIGDTPYDVEASQRAGVPVIAFRCGGWNDVDLQGAVAIYDGPWDLLSRLDESPLARRP